MNVSPSSSYFNQVRIDRVIKGFKERYGEDPETVVRVPGRVNLIGEHIDYCGYAVHPMAIQQDVLVAIRKSGDRTLTLKNASEQYRDFHLDLGSGTVEIKLGGTPEWWNYFLCGVKGVLEDVVPGGEPVGYRVFVNGKIPPSAGLSSSSAMVVSAAICTLWANNKEVRLSDLADLCARSERFIGTMGGGMDQAIEILAEEGTAKLIEFNPLKAYDVTLPKGATFVIANSLSTCNKADIGGGSQYNVRVAECRMATKILGKAINVEGWKEISKLGELQKKSGKSIYEMVSLVKEKLREQPYTLPEVAELLELKSVEELVEMCSVPEGIEKFKLHHRAMHVYTEAKRVYDFKSTCDLAQVEAGDKTNTLKKLGRLMYESHESCSKLYECSHPALDELVDLSNLYGAYGARLTGAGWGGCIVALVPEESLNDYIKGLKTKYFGKINSVHCKSLEAMDAVIFPSSPGAGAQLYTVN